MSPRFSNDQELVVRDKGDHKLFWNPYVPGHWCSLYEAHVAQSPTKIAAPESGEWVSFDEAEAGIRWTEAGFWFLFDMTDCRDNAAFDTHAAFISITRKTLALMDERLHMLHQVAARDRNANQLDFSCYCDGPSLCPVTCEQYNILLENVDGGHELGRCDYLLKPGTHPSDEEIENSIRMEIPTFSVHGWPNVKPDEPISKDDDFWRRFSFSMSEKHMDTTLYSPSVDWNRFLRDLDAAGYPIKRYATVPEPGACKI